MPRLRTKNKNKFKPGQTVVCWRTFGAPSNVVPEGVVRKGTKLGGNHPRGAGVAAALHRRRHA
jgi:hypothetical protein